MEKIIVTLWITFGIYLMVLLAIMADLWSGVRKAKQNNIVRSSYCFSRHNWQMYLLEMLIG